MNAKKKLITAVVITASVFILATIINVGINIFDSITKRDIRLQGDATHVEVKNIYSTEQPMNLIYGINSQLDYVKSAQPYSYLGKATNNTQGVIEIFRATPFSSNAWWQILKPAYTNIKGHSPEAENEIMASRRALELLGVDNPKIGMEIMITYDLYDIGVQKTKTFILSGLFTDYTHLADRPTCVFVSNEFANTIQLLSQTEENKEAIRAATNNHGIAVVFANGGKLEENIEKLKRDFNLTDDHISISPAYSGAFDNINANVFALDFYLLIYICAAVLTVIIITVRGIIGKKTKKVKGARNNV